MVEWSAYPNKLSIYLLQDNIDIDKEVKNDYLILKEVEKLVKEELGQDKEMDDGFSVIYYEKDEFNLKDYLKRSEHAKFYRTQLNKNFMPNQLDDILEKYYKNQNDPKRPKRVFEYYITKEHHTYEEFEQAVKESAKEKKEKHLRREEIYGK